MLKTRVITAVILAPLAIAAVFIAPTPWLAAILAALFTIGMWEMQGMVSRALASRIIWSAALVAACGALWFWPQWARPIMIAAAIWWFAAIVWLANHQWGQSGSLLSRWIKSIVSLITMVAAWAALVELHGINPLWMFTVLLMIWAADIGAYFSGKAWGEAKLAPTLSPGKTWVGAGGGIAAATAVGLALAIMFDIDQPLLLLALLLAATAIVSIVGDLFISLIKRQAQVKDTGHIFPGHGGVLDRFDSLIAAAPVFATLRWWLL